MYSKLPNLVIAFHGCDIETFEKVLYRHEPLNSSNNDYDWLGNGIYFWEQNLERAWQWAKGKKEPAVIGAIIDLGKCLNLTDSESISLLKKQYEIFKLRMQMTGQEMPTNKNIKNNHDELLRRLDCAVIESLHEDTPDDDKFDSVRGVFIEGDPIYTGAGIREKTHIQICIRNPNCIKGYFAPKPTDISWNIP